MKFLFANIILVLISGCATPGLNQDPSHWIEINRPPPDSEEGYVFNSATSRSMFYWWVSNRDGVVQASLDKYIISRHSPGFFAKTEKFSGGKSFQKVSDGWLVGFNNGEFGAELWWFSKDGRESYKISNDQIQQFITSNNRVFAIQGLSHMGLSRGSFIEVKLEKGQWTAKQVKKLSQAPVAITKTPDGSFVIVLTDSVVTLDKIFHKKVIVDKTRWGTFYPSSVAFKSPHTVFIGMRQYVVEVSLDNGKTRYLIPGNQYSHKLPPEKEKIIRKEWHILYEELPNKSR